MKYYAPVIKVTFLFRFISHSYFHYIYLLLFPSTSGTRLEPNKLQNIFEPKFRLLLFITDISLGLLKTCARFSFAHCLTQPLVLKKKIQRCPLAVHLLPPMLYPHYAAFVIVNWYITFVTSGAVYSNRREGKFHALTLSILVHHSLFALYSFSPCLFF